MRWSLATLVVSVALGAEVAPTSPPLFAGLPPGSEAVGFAQVHRGELVVSYWYPALKSGPALSFADYLGPSSRAWAASLQEHGVSAADAASLLHARTMAVKSAKPLGHPSPLVLIAQGNGQDAADQAVLAEFLASHGFAVATTPSPTIRHPMASERDIPDVAGRQADELVIAAGIVADQGIGTHEPAAVIGHSFGARAALLMAMRDPRIERIVSLDGGIGTATGADAFRRSRGWNDAVHARVLHFYERLDDFMTPDFTLLRSLPQLSVETVELPGMHHVHFATLGFGAALAPTLAQATGAGAPLRDSLRTMAVRTLAFLR